ncbi:putative endo-beta-N-acetylglucosaminidase [Trypanosoma cruzi]|uniref:Uncharacterized protein n=1 Tax=Trypanosoma cruzi (strain CL Brener) TaxID=353153 RepID=Q4DP27_TRYCC|nr:hypothetical protein Tc00.1047053506999.160 [Trypanosoma cruzi]EAN94291.1 hypothetical protein Tc00.1047053506999.160 [Trypanosoma cruzi]RNC50016.1 putative endo-beta-N-acetylglucosaminidase [Trypanosoma cruzi]|eukprot:XP_816142.1 hypothetical protein [Trypanosoma cruzi strain CL Brener]
MVKGRGAHSRRRRTALLLTAAAAAVTVLLYLSWRNVEEAGDEARSMVRPSPFLITASQARGNTLYQLLLPEEIGGILPGNITAFISPRGTHKGQEVPHFDYGDGPRRYRNPYHPMRRTLRPCHGLLYTKGNWLYNSSLGPPIRFSWEYVGML